MEACLSTFSVRPAEPLRFQAYLGPTTVHPRRGQAEHHLVDDDEVPDIERLVERFLQDGAQRHAEQAPKGLQLVPPAMVHPSTAAVDGMMLGSPIDLMSMTEGCTTATTKGFSEGTPAWIAATPPPTDRLDRVPPSSTNSIMSPRESNGRQSVVPSPDHKLHHEGHDASRDETTTIEPESCERDAVKLCGRNHGPSQDPSLIRNRAWSTPESAGSPVVSPHDEPLIPKPGTAVGTAGDAEVISSGDDDEVPRIPRRRALRRSLQASARLRDVLDDDPPLCPVRRKKRTGRALRTQCAESPNHAHRKAAASYDANILVRCSWAPDGSLTMAITAKTLRDLVATGNDADRHLPAPPHHSSSMRDRSTKRQHMRSGVAQRYSQQEDRLLVKLKERTYPLLTWTEIAQHFPGRSQGSLQVRYCTALKKRA